MTVKHGALIITLHLDIFQSCWKFFYYIAEAPLQILVQASKTKWTKLVWKVKPFNKLDMDLPASREKNLPNKVVQFRCQENRTLDFTPSISVKLRGWINFDFKTSGSALKASKRPVVRPEFQDPMTPIRDPKLPITSESQTTETS